MNRRNFISALGLGSCGMLIPNSLLASNKSQSVCAPEIKPISGSWFEFQHMGHVEGEYWNGHLASFTAEQWKEKVFEIREIGMEYLVLMSVASTGKAFYPTKLASLFPMACSDPLEAVLSAADECGIKFFVSNDFWADASNMEIIMRGAETKKIREKSMEEIAARYSHHKSFYGWYFPNEAYLHPYFDEFVIDYVNECAAIAKKLMPTSVNLIAPYHIKEERADDGFVKQLERMNIEIIAYQDGVGVNSTRLGEPARYFEHLYCAHQKAARARIWADMELFYFEQGTHGNLLPADFETRIVKQMKDLSPFVDKILVYQYIGIMNKPNSKAHAGHKDSIRLYNQYKTWLDKQK
jgi:hypothetical protein